MHYISRIRMTESGMRDLVSRRSHGAYSFHKMVWKLFPGHEGDQRSFIYSVSDDGRTVYCVSETVPVCDDGMWTVETKEYSPKLSEGMILRFSTKVNPVVANSSTGKHRKHDVVMDMKHKLRESGDDIPMEQIIHDSVYGWFRRKGSMNGFDPLNNELMIHSYQRNESYKAGVQKISFSSVVIEGYLRVTDVLLFEKALFGGIGSSKGFGCGLMMVRRP